jgi:hypothetical protein
LTKRKKIAVRVKITIPVPEYFQRQKKWMKIQLLFFTGIKKQTKKHKYNEL